MRLGEASPRSVIDPKDHVVGRRQQLLHRRVPVAQSPWGESIQYRTLYDTGTSLPRRRSQHQLSSYCSRSPMFNYYAADPAHQARAVQDYPMASKILENSLPRIVKDEVRSFPCTAGPLRQLATFPQINTPAPCRSGTEPGLPQDGSRQCHRGDHPGCSRSCVKTLWSRALVARYAPPLDESTMAPRAAVSLVPMQLMAAATGVLSLCVDGIYTTSAPIIVYVVCSVVDHVGNS